MNKVAIIIVSLILAMALSLSGCTGAGRLGPVGHLVPYEDISFTVETKTGQTMTINMAKGAVFEGYLTVRGSKAEIFFTIQNPYGEQVEFLRVTNRHDFSYKAPLEGFYTVGFYNFFPEDKVDKDVYLHYRVR